MSLPSDDVLNSWNRIMRYQVDFSFPLELPAYLTLESWSSANQVLDLGSSDGYYTKRLAEYFQDKSYTCIDIDPRAIESGRTQSAASGGDSVTSEKCRIEFESGNVLNYRGSYPAAIARLLVQHLDAPEALFMAAPNFLRNDGILIVIDSNDKERCFWPLYKYKIIDRFFEEFNEFQPARNHSTAMLKSARDFGFDVEVHKMVTIPSSIPTYKNLFHISYRLFFEIVEQHYKMPFDYEGLSCELELWAQDPGSYAQIGVNVCAYRFVSEV